MAEQSLAARVADLEEQVAHLSGELGLSIKLTNIKSVMVEMRLPAGQAKIVLALHSAKGRCLSVYQLADATQIEEESIKVLINRIRNRFKEVESHRGCGYSLTEGGLRYVSTLLEASATTRRGASV